MKRTRVMTAVLLSAGALGLQVAQAQQPGIKRTDLMRHDLMRHDLSAAGREVIQVLVDFGPAVVAPRHSHPGEEIVYVVEGSLEYQLDGRPRRRCLVERHATAKTSTASPARSGASVAAAIRGSLRASVGSRTV